MSMDTLQLLKINENDKLLSTYLCGTCKKYLMAKKIPPLAAKNGLSIETMPDGLELSELESVLCSRNIIFAKIHTLPKNWCLGSKDKVVNVPINSEDLRTSLDKIKTFPRQPMEGGLLPVAEAGISVKLKRKLSYKGNHLARIINPKKVIAATQHFKDIGHPLYQDIDINQNYVPEVHFDEPDPSIGQAFTVSEPESPSNVEDPPENDGENTKSVPDDASGDEVTDEEDDRLEAVKKNQFDQMQHFVMADDHPESKVVTSSSKSIKDLNLAPGEGKIPSSLMRDETWDIGGFPDLHPSGKYGLHHKRDTKITHQKYFTQRLQNINPQF